jgi:hypothetical protein
MTPTTANHALQRRPARQAGGGRKSLTAPCIQHGFSLAAAWTWTFGGATNYSLVRAFVFLPLSLLIMGCDPRKHRPYPPAVLCQSGLRQIEGAKLRWAEQLQKTTNDVPTDTDLFGLNGYVSEKPKCPSGGTYTLGRVAESPICSVHGPIIRPLDQ